MDLDEAMKSQNYFRALCKHMNGCVLPLHSFLPLPTQMAPGLIKSSGQPLT